MRSVLVITGYYVPAVLAGGPVRSLEAMIENKRGDDRPLVVASRYDLDGSLLATSRAWTQVGRAFVRYFGSNIDLVKALVGISNHDVRWIYVNSLFSVPAAILPMLLKRLGWMSGIPVVLAPRGQLYPGALAIRGRRKRAFLWLARCLNVYRFDLIQATNRDERKQIESWFPNTPVIEHANETRLPTAPLSPSDTAAGRPRIVFLSRLSEKKGLHVLLAALRDTPLAISLDVYGSFEEAEYRAKIMSILRDVGESVSVTFRGPADPDEVLGILNDYDALVLPTAGENFGHVIAEALAASCPVVITRHTPWTSTVRGYGAGLVVGDSAEAWSAAIHEVASMPPDRRAQWKVAAGQAHEEQNFSVAKQGFIARVDRYFGV